MLTKSAILFLVVKREKPILVQKGLFFFLFFFIIVSTCIFLELNCILTILHLHIDNILSIAIYCTFAFKSILLTKNFFTILTHRYHPFPLYCSNSHLWQRFDGSGGCRYLWQSSKQQQQSKSVDCIFVLLSVWLKLCEIVIVYLFCRYSRQSRERSAKVWNVANFWHCKLIL